MVFEAESLPSDRYRELVIGRLYGNAFPISVLEPAGDLFGIAHSAMQLRLAQLLGSVSGDFGSH